MNKRFGPRRRPRGFGGVGAARHPPNGFLLLAAPADPETIEQSLAFADSLRLESLKITAGIRVYPGTLLAARAVSDGLIAAGDDLLQPRFYVALPSARRFRGFWRADD